MFRILSNRLILKQLTLADVDCIYNGAIESKEEMQPWLPWCHTNYQKIETITWVSSQIELWKEGKEFSFAIFERDTEEFVGGIGLNEINKSYLSGNLGYWIKTSNTKKGYATEASIMCSKFGFDELKLRRIEIVIVPDNFPSRRVAEKLKAVYECTARNKILMHGKSYDACVYSLIPEDLQWCAVEYNIS